MTPVARNVCVTLAEPVNVLMIEANDATLCTEALGGPGDPPILLLPLASITAPTLVIHGTANPMFPLGHGQALAGEIPTTRAEDAP